MSVVRRALSGRCFLWPRGVEVTAICRHRTTDHIQNTDDTCQWQHTQWSSLHTGPGLLPASVLSKDVLFLVTRLVAYWPAPIHAVEHANLYCRHVTSGRLAVCYSQIRSILSSATAFPTATLRWQQSRYRTINGKKIKTCNFVSVIKYISCIYD